MSKYRFNSRFEHLENEDKVIIANSVNGKWIKQSRECYEIVKDIIEGEKSVEEYLEEFDIEDRDYLDTLIGKLKYMEVISDRDDTDDIEPVKSITLSLTKNCNLMCIHCSYNAKHNRTPEQDLTYEQVINIVDKIIAVKPERITITGGEPLVRKDIFKILQYIRENFDGEIGLMTNGVLINKSNVERLTSLVKIFDISLDGYNQESCDFIRGKGVFNSVIRSIGLLQSHGITDISLSMVIVEQTRTHLQDFYKLCRELKVQPVPRIFSPIGRGLDNKDKLELKGEVNLENQLNAHGKKTQGSYKQLLDVCTCGGGFDELYIDYDGNIGPCPLFMDTKFQIGNISEINLNEYFNNKEYKRTKSFSEFKNYLPRHREKCKNCNVNIFCWTCPHMIHVEYKDEEKFEERCKYMKEILTESVWGNFYE